MTHAQTDTPVPMPPLTDGEAEGWYLYGITAGHLAEDAGHASDTAPCERLACGDLSAVVRRVPRADFSPAALQARLGTAAALEEMVRAHNAVIAAVHGRQAIIPAKFGAVYPDAASVVSALRSRHDVLLAHLQRIDGCDEWAVHLYADTAVLARHVAAADPELAALRAEQTAASPGRAWFLSRRLQEAERDGTARALRQLAQACHDRLARHAEAVEVGALREAATSDGAVEILRAAFLVARDGLADFEAEVRACAGTEAGLRCEYSGPWPPYSFAAAAEGAQ